MAALVNLYPFNLPVAFTSCRTLALRPDWVTLIQPRYNPPLHNFAVLNPILSIFLMAGLVVPHLPMKQKDGEVDDIEVRQRGAKSSRQAPGPCHDPIPELVQNKKHEMECRRSFLERSYIIWMPRAAPPPTRKQVSPSFGLHGSQV